jgi:hypothetical protein
MARRWHATNRLLVNGTRKAVTVGELRAARMRIRRYKVFSQLTLYSSCMASTGDLRVSARGQLSLPAAARHRWRLADGGEVGYLDLGDALLLVPGGVNALRRKMIDAITEDGWRDAVAGFGDPDLANE